MAVRQYIGARYVIKIYENSVDTASAEWESSTNYERLTMVTYNYGSYLSKKDVPASVGNPADNPTYWVQTGFYNGQIASLQDQINNINAAIGDVDDLETSSHIIVDAINEIKNSQQRIDNRKYIFVGDSYGDEVSLPDVRGWWRYLSEYLGLSTSDYYEACKSGGGFNRPVPEKRYITILQNIENSVSDKNAITDILIAGGYNDIDQIQADIVTRAEELKEYITTTYPNARIWIAPIGWTTEVTYDRLTMFRSMIYNYLSLSEIGFLPIDGGYLAHHNYANFRDAAHPTSEANKQIAKYLYAGLTNSKYKTVVNQLIQSLTPDASATALGTPLFNANQDGNVITLFTSAQVQYTTPMSISADGSNKCPLGTLSDGLIKGCADANIPISINCYYDDGTDYHSCDGQLYIEDGVVSVAPVVYSGRSYETITVSRIGYLRTHITLDALNC